MISKYNCGTYGHVDSLSFTLFYNLISRIPGVAQDFKNVNLQKSV